MIALSNSTGLAFPGGFMVARTQSSPRSEVPDVIEGLKVGERVAAAGSFKLRDGVKVIEGPPAATDSNVVSGSQPAASAGG